MNPSENEMNRNGFSPMQFGEMKATVDHLSQQVDKVERRVWYVAIFSGAGAFLGSNVDKLAG